MKLRKVLFTVLLSAFALTSCANNNNKEEGSSVSNEDSTVSSQTEDSNEVVRLTTTTSVNDSGLMDYLKDDFKKDTNLTMEIVSKGTGAAIEDAKKGNADVILVHSPSQEEEFMDEGYGMDRVSFMHNYFVIVGPSDDPAGIKDKDAVEAFSLINESKSKFASRGDESGTHTKEKKLWEEASVNLDDLEKEDNYNSLGQGMGDTLTFASENGAYTLTDLSTFLSMKNDLNLEVLVDHVENAKKFQDWMTGENASKLIEDYGKEEYGQPLFFLGK